MTGPPQPQPALHAFCGGRILVESAQTVPRDAATVVHILQLRNPLSWPVSYTVPEPAPAPELPDIVPPEAPRQPLTEPPARGVQGQIAEALAALNAPVRRGEGAPLPQVPTTGGAAPGASGALGGGGFTPSPAGDAATRARPGGPTTANWLLAGQSVTIRIPAPALPPDSPLRFGAWRNLAIRCAG
jgi:hypothetical protein